MATAPEQSQGSEYGDSLRTLSRRGFLAGMLVLPRLAMAQSRGDTVSVINAGTNVVYLTNSSGLILLVDTGSPENAPGLFRNLPIGDSDSLIRIQPINPLTAIETREINAAGHVVIVFNTHYHADNTGSNEAFGKAGGRILAHVNTKQWMSTPYWIPAEDRYSTPRPKAAQPTETFYTTGSLKAGSEQIDYGYLIEAHTSGDIYVFFRNANLLAVGDVASPARDPELDYFTGAWIGGRVDAMDRLLKLADDETRIVPGFGPVMTRAQLKAERDMMSTIYDRTVDRVREADTPEEMLKAGVLDGLPRTFKDPGKFIYDLHKGLWAHHNKLNHNVV
ncbi:MAG TPA: MBL fold metallo-hydrolase [Terriglobia bacterium]|nr:MBL fold metallo-hydrolase [Terriglobia bacterium]